MGLGIALPVWLGASERTDSVAALVEYWKSADDLDSPALSGDFADEIYMFQPWRALSNEVTAAHCSSVMLTLGLDEIKTPAFTENLYKEFLYRVRRQDASYIAALRPFASNLEKGMDYVNLTVEGTRREFYVYVPSAVKNGKISNVPVVIVFHGANGSGDDIAARTGWDKVAEERDFIAVFPTGSRTNAKVKVATAWDGSDIPFFKDMRTYLLENYSIDPTRVYVSGQSAGCGMAQRVALVCPELIAASAASSMMLDLSTIEDARVDLAMPIMVSNGDMDKHFVEGGDAYLAVPGRVAQIIARYGITDTEENTAAYQNGKFHGYEFRNAQGIPVFREQWVTEKVHAFIPEEAYVEYDFLSSYSRDENGTSYYMGLPIEGVQ